MFYQKKIYIYIDEFFFFFGKSLIEKVISICKTSKI